MSKFQKPVPVNFEKGKIIFSEGDIDAGSYLIQVGLVELSFTKNGIRKVVDTVAPGSLIGEMSAYDDKPRFYTATAKENVTALKIDAVYMKAQLAQSPKFIQTIIKTLIERAKAMKNKG